MAINRNVQSTNGKELRKNLLSKVGMRLGRNFKMNHEHRQVANSILSRLKDGEEFSRSTIDQALRDTGDIAPIGSAGLDKTVQEEDKGGGESRSMGMVAANLIRLSEKTWAKSSERITETNEQ
jgi:hypothetical protein